MDNVLLAPEYSPLSRSFAIVAAATSADELLQRWQEEEWDAVLLETGTGYNYLTQERLQAAMSVTAAAASCAVLMEETLSTLKWEEWLRQNDVAGIAVSDGSRIVAVTSPALIVQSLVRQQQDLQARFQSVLDILNEAVCVIDAADRVVVWNKSSELLYGITTREIIGQPIDQFFSNLVLTRDIKEKNQVKDKYHNPCPGKHVLINAAPVKRNGEVIGGVCSERDIAEIVNLNQELTHVSQKVQSLEKTIDRIHTHADAFAAICGHTPAIRQAIQMARKVAEANVPLLLRGESGTGKELFAQAIHNASLRPGRFIAINCGAIPANLFESELFGYEAGAFTGADRKGKSGFFELATQGTLFLDEIGELPKEMQVKLLRVLQEKTYFRIGGSKSVQVDVRIIAATHSDLEAMIAAQQFRGDLYYRLNVVSLMLPPLRERREDIPELVYRGLKHFGQLHSCSIEKVDPALLSLFLEHQWPGNVRELYNVLERLVILTEGNILTPANLPADFIGTATMLSHHANAADPVALLPSSLSGIDALEKQLIETVLKEEHYNKAAAAKRLSIPRSTLYYKMKQWSIADQR